MMKGMAERLQEEMVKSDEFTRRNFGLQLGSDYPEIARELFADAKTAEKLAMAWLGDQVFGRPAVLALIEAVKQGISPSPHMVLDRFPEVLNLQMSYLYWGLQIGRQLEREQEEMLRSMREEGVR